MTMFRPIRKSTSGVGNGMISMAMIITMRARISSSGRAVTLRRNLSSMISTDLSRSGGETSRQRGMSLDGFMGKHQVGQVRELRGDAR